MSVTQEDLQKAFDNAALEHKKAVLQANAAVLERVEAIEKKGFVDPELKEKIDRMFTRVDELDVKLGAPTPSNVFRDQPSIGQSVLDSPKFKEWQKDDFRASERVKVSFKGFFPIPEQKTPINTGSSTAGLGSATSGVQNFIRLPELIQLQRQNITMRDLLRVRPMGSGNSVDWLKQNVATRNASPQTEASAKAESTITYTTGTSQVRTIAHFMQLTRQALDDVPWLRQDIDSELMFGLKLKEDTELLSGDGIGDHINGLATQATAYDTATYNVSGDTRLDKLRHMILQARLAYYPVDGIVLNPRDVAAIDLIKTEEGGANKGVYIVGDPRTGMSIMTIWGKPVVESDSIPSGKALVGAFGLGAILFDRMQAVIDLSLEHNLNFTTNQVTILAEERIALAVTRPASFIYGTCS